MLEIKKTEEFIQWLDSLFDLMGRAKIQARIKRLSEGNPGISKSVGDGVFEMKINFGPRCRVYYTLHKNILVILLMGGDKKSQTKDIQLAKRLAKHL